MRHFVLASLWIAACGKPSIFPDDAAARAALEAHCEASTPALEATVGGMLPGRRCLACHGPGGDGPAFRAAGTVFGKGAMTCNEGGVHDVEVEFLATDGSTIATVTTGQNGNFHWKDGGSGPFRIRLKSGANVSEKHDAVDTGDCASCHDGTTRPRLTAP